MRPLPILLALVLAACAAQPPLIVRAVTEGDACRVHVDGAAYAPDELTGPRLQTLRLNLKNHHLLVGAQELIASVDKIEESMTSAAITMNRLIESGRPVGPLKTLDLCDILGEVESRWVACPTTGRVRCKSGMTLPAVLRPVSNRAT